MATQSQYEFFKLLYDEETARYSDLENRAKLYFGVISFYLGAIAIKFEDASAFLQALNVTTPVALFVAACMIISLAFCVFGVQIRSYEGIAEAGDVVDSFGDSVPTDEDFFDARIADFVVATAKNSEQNNRVATYLSISAGALALAMIGQILLLAYLTAFGG